MCLGSILRFLNLGSKPLWTDEVATMVFSLGNDYQGIPLNQVISLVQLLQPLQFNSQATLTDVAQKLTTQDNHPPLYFLLAHLWLHLFPSADSHLSLWVARALPALLGILAIPLTYLLAKLAFRSHLVAQLAAALMAVSPYGVFLAQEARHYTLGIVFVILSLCCFVTATRRLCYRQVIPWYLTYTWLIVNCLGLGIHYFFSLTLLAQCFIIIGILLYQIKEQKFSLILWLPIIYIALGIITTGLVWSLQIIPRGFGHGMTDWLEPEVINLRVIISPVFQLLAAWITMISLLPIESNLLGIILVSGLVMIIFFLGLLPQLIRAFRDLWQEPQQRLNIRIIGGFLLSAIALFLLISYGLGMDITRGARYSFVYFPAVLILLALGLGKVWENPRQRKLVFLVFLMGLGSAITVTSNLGYQKYYKADQLKEIMQNQAHYPVLIATSHRTLVQTGEMIGLGWELKREKFPLETKFILVHQTQKNSAESTQILKDSVARIPKPLEVWAVNFQAPVDLEGCRLSPVSLPSVSGYDYEHYFCGENVAKETVKPELANLD